MLTRETHCLYLGVLGEHSSVFISKWLLVFIWSPVKKSKQIYTRIAFEVQHSILFLSFETVRHLILVYFKFNLV